MVRGKRGGGEGRDYFFGDPYAGIDGRRNLVSSFFGGSDPFDDPLFNCMFASNMFGPSGPTMFGEAPPSASSFIEEIVSHDEEGKGLKTANPMKHSRSEEPYHEAEERKTKTLEYKNEYNLEDIIQFTVDASSTTRRMGNDGVVVVEESKEADTTTHKATHALSRGILDKGHSVFEES